MSRDRQGARLLGLGALACAACCAGPILGLVATIGIGVLAAWVGLVALVLAVPLGTLVHRRRRCTPPTLVRLEAPARR